MRFTDDESPDRRLIDPALSREASLDFNAI